MRKLLFTLFSFAIVLSLGAQDVTFFDDFEGYADGDPIAATSDVWASWGSPGGGADDANVSAEQAFSGSLSLKLEAQAAAGGPTDIVLPFGGKYESGNFVYEQMMYIVSGTGAYFNFQGETTVGQEWVASNYFRTTGTVDWANSGNAIVGQSSFPFDEWFKVRFEIDLTNNLWVVSLNGAVVAEYANVNNSIASANLYAFNPDQGASTVYVDDVTFEYAEPVLLQLDASATNVLSRRDVLTGQDVAVSFAVKNIGIDYIESFTATLDDGTNTASEDFDGQFIGSLEEVTFSLPATYTALEGANDIMITISNVNGGTDLDMDNNTASATVTGYTPAQNKQVFVEEGTGTWCGWCPRGDIFLKYMDEEYSEYFIGIGVHSGDPMEVNGYPAASGFSAYPTMKIGREEIFGFGTAGDIESRFFPRVIQSPPAVLGATATYDELTSDVVITASAEFSGDVNGSSLALVIVEDNVTGTGAGYNQTNYYAGGGQGQMGGYELLPDPVPAAQMIYKHVARAVLGGVTGEPGSIPATASAGETHTYDFPIAFNPTWNVNEIDIVVTLMAADGTVINAKKVDFNDAAGIVGTNDLFRNDLAKVYPNPFSEMTNLELNLEESTDVHLTVYNMAGLLVAEKDYGQLSGKQVLPFDGSTLGSGMYFMHIRLDDSLITKKVTLNR